MGSHALPGHLQSCHGSSKPLDMKARQATALESHCVQKRNSRTTCCASHNELLLALQHYVGRTSWWLSKSVERGTCGCMKPPETFDICASSCGWTFPENPPCTMMTDQSPTQAAYDAGRVRIPNMHSQGANVFARHSALHTEAVRMQHLRQRRTCISKQVCTEFADYETARDACRNCAH